MYAITSSSIIMSNVMFTLAGLNYLPITISHFYIK